MTLKDSANKVLVNLLVGKRGRQSVVGAKTQQLYVRKKGDRQSWLVEGYLPLSLEFKDWVNQPLLPITANDIRKVVITNNHTKKLPIILVKEKDDVNLYVKEGEKDKAPLPIQLNNSLIHLLSNLEYSNVVSYKERAGNWRPNLKIEIETANNTKLHIEFAKVKQSIYARVFTNIDNDKSNIQTKQEASKFNKINEFSNAWLFQVSEDIYDLATKPKPEMLDLLKS